MMHREKKSTICPRCRKLINRDEPACPYCGLRNPGSPWQSLLRLKMFYHPVDAIKALIIVNAVFYLFTIIIDPQAIGLSANPLTFLSPSSGSLFLVGATGTIPIGQFHRWWTLVSASYLHGGILHIFFNMAALWQLGPFVAHEYGLSRFFTIYTLGGIVGFLVSHVAGVPFTIGASASLCGLIGATLYYGKSRGGFYGNAIFRQVMGWIMGLGIFGFLVPGINNWAHGGGILAGIVGGFLLGYIERRQESGTDRLLGLICVLLTAGVLAWAVIQSILFIFTS